MKRPFLTIGRDVNGRNLWQFGTGSTILHTWLAPRWLSFVDYFSTVKT
jgi:hypothetical protein